MGRISHPEPLHVCRSPDGDESLFFTHLDKNTHWRMLFLNYSLEFNTISKLRDLELEIWLFTWILDFLMGK